MIAEISSDGKPSDEISYIQKKFLRYGLRCDMRRRYIGAILVLGFVFLMLFFYAYEYRIIGAWKGDGDIDVVGMETSFEFAELLIFKEDGTAIAVVGEEQRVFDFSMTDDTLTLTDKETKTSYGIFYRLIGNRLVLKTGGGNSSEFIRMQQID